MCSAVQCSAVPCCTVLMLMEVQWEDERSALGSG